ncbi:MAG TPA: dihydrofolate reductase family protein [Longimicrobiaceae bacterium]|nr:dihydrofolate reductase family protein [Longimicrobiaceae bacterium]
MRRVRYQVAMSLDGYIAGPNGEYDWIVSDPEVDFSAMFAQYDTFLMGRKTFEPAAEMAASHGGRTYVFSRTLRQEDYPGVTIISGGAAETVRALKEEEGKDIWLFGGGLLSRELLEAGLVDTVETAIIPVLVGGGIQLLPPPAPRTKLRLTGRRIYETSGIVLLEYAVEPPGKKGKKRKR